MILDITIAGFRSYTILDALTGKCLDNERIYYADSDRGFYRRYLSDKNGMSYVWDRRTKQPADAETPKKFQELAWELVHRPIAIFRKGTESDEEKAQ